MSDQAPPQLGLDFGPEAKPVAPAPADSKVRRNVALFSPCGRYRYTLTRELGGDRPVAIMGLNPSKATADEDDPTIRKDIGFATRWGFGRILKPNAHAYIATDPDDMKRAAKAGIDVVGPDNDDLIRTTLGFILLSKGTFVVAWGNHITPARQAAIVRIIRFSGVVPMCLGTNKNGTPKHELYLAWTTPLVTWSHP